MHRVGSESLPPPSAVRISGNSGRLITVVRTPHGELFCIDFFCYHMGGRLGEGDLVEIEEVCRAPYLWFCDAYSSAAPTPIQMGSWALKCPAHGRLIRTNGEALEQQDGHCTSMGLRQRTHEVTVDADGNLCVRLSKDSPCPLESDIYNLPQQTACVQTSIGFQARKRRATQAVQAKLNARQDEHTKNPVPAVIVVAAGVSLRVPAHGVGVAHQGTTTPAPSPSPSLRQAKIYDMFRSIPSATAAEMMETD